MLVSWPLLELAAAAAAAATVVTVANALVYGCACGCKSSCLFFAGTESRRCHIAVRGHKTVSLNGWRSKFSIVDKHNHRLPVCFFYLFIYLFYLFIFIYFIYVYPSLAVLQLCEVKTWDWHIMHIEVEFLFRLMIGNVAGLIIIVIIFPIEKLWGSHFLKWPLSLVNAGFLNVFFLLICTRINHEVVYFVLAAAAAAVFAAFFILL